MKESNSTTSVELVNATTSSITAGKDVRIANEVQNDLTTRPDGDIVTKSDTMTAEIKTSTVHHQGTKLTVVEEKDDRISTIASPSIGSTAKITATTEKSVSLEHISMTSSIQQLNFTSSSIKLKNESIANHTTVKFINQTTTTEIVAVNFANDTDTSADVRKGYLVFSEHCRIPDIDPMDPSIVHLISKTPPLDCSVSITTCEFFFS